MAEVDLIDERRGFILRGSLDPSAGTGVQAPVGAIYLRDDGAGNGSAWIKTGAAPTAWARIGTV